MRVLLVHPPRGYWPYVSEGDNFLVQQALPALAAVAREEGHEVKAIDCLPIRMGWRTLYEEVKDFKPIWGNLGDDFGVRPKQLIEAMLVKDS